LRPVSDNFQTVFNLSEFGLLKFRRKCPPYSISTHPALVSASICAVCKRSEFCDVIYCEKRHLQYFQAVASQYDCTYRELALAMESTGVFWSEPVQPPFTFWVLGLGLGFWLAIVVAIVVGLTICTRCKRQTSSVEQLLARLGKLNDERTSVVDEVREKLTKLNDAASKLFKEDSTLSASFAQVSQLTTDLHLASQGAERGSHESKSGAFELQLLPDLSVRSTQQTH